MNSKRRRGTTKSSIPRGNSIGAAGPGAMTTGVAEILKEGFKHHQAGRFSEAEAHYRQILAIDSRNAEALYLLGLMAFQAGRIDTCVQLTGEAIKQNKRNPFYFSLFGDALQALKRFDEALASYDKALKLKPDLVDVLNNRGVALRSLNRLDEALASYDRALELKPDFAQVHYNRGNALRELGRVDEARQSYEKALMLKPDYTQAFRGLAVLNERNVKSDRQFVSS